VTSLEQVNYLEETFSLRGKVALVTGSTRGLGFAIASALASAGAHVVLNSRNAEEVAAKARQLTQAGQSASAAPFDVSDESAMLSSLESIFRTHGRLDILVNNAGIIHRGKFVDVKTESWRQVVDVNLTACFVLAREAGRHMAGRGTGRIINVGSVMSGIARWGAPAYVATKHGLVGLTKAIAVELGHKGVTCNTIAPGFFRTELNVSQQQNAKVSAQIEARVPLRRWAEPKELAGAAVFLASDASSYVNGLTLYVDGGLTAAF
jgi:gluconate 5-dehydrogenase